MQPHPALVTPQLFWELNPTVGTQPHQELQKIANPTYDFIKQIFFVTETMNLEYRTDELYRQAEETTILISLVRRQSDNTVRSWKGFYAWRVNTA